MAAGLIRRLFSTAAPRLSEDPLHQRLSSIGINRVEIVAETIDGYITSGGKIDRFQLLSCARQLRSKPAHALQIIDWMEARHIGLGHAEHALRIELITRLKGIDAAESYFNSLPPSVKNMKVTLEELLFCYCQAPKVDKALQVFATMDNMNMIDGVAPINNLMSMYINVRLWEKVPPLMEEVKKRNIQPTGYTYNLLMRSYLLLNDVEGVERVIEEMKRDKVSCDWSTYSNLANLYINVGLRGKAEVALKMMEEMMDSSKSESFHILISLYAKISDHESTNRIWKSLKSNFKQVTSMSYLTMLQALCKLNDMDGMKKLYVEWESTCSVFDIRLANTLVDAYLRHDKPDEAALIFRGVLDRSQGPIFEACEHFMAYHLKKHQVTQALQYLEVATSKSKDQEWRPKKCNIYGFLRYFIKGNDVSSAKLFCELSNMTNYVHNKAYEWLLHKVSNTLAIEDYMEVKAEEQSTPRWSEDPLYRRLSALGINKGEMVTETIDGYISEGRKVDKLHLFACARELCKYNRSNHALQIINWMDARNIKIGYAKHALRIELLMKLNGIDAAENYFNSLPPPAKKKKMTLLKLLFCFCEATKVDKALEVFATMDSMNMIDSVAPINNLMSMYTKIRLWEKVPPLMEEVRKRNIQPANFTYNLLMRSLLHSNDVEGVERVFEEMKQDTEVHCNWATYSNLANLYASVGLRGKAEMALKLMEEVMDSNDREHFRVLITMYAKFSDHENVHRIWKSLKSNFKHVTSMDYLNMLQALCKLNDIDGMKKCYEERESTCSIFDIRLANALIRTYLIHDKHGEAALLFRSVLNRSQGPIFKACEYFMAYHLNKHQIVKALQYLEVATSKNKDLKWQPKKYNIYGFLRYFIKGNDVSSTKKFCELSKMINSGHSEAYEWLLHKVSTKVKTGAQSTPRWSGDPLYRRLSALGINKGEMVAETIDGYISKGRKVDKFQLFACACELCKYNRSDHALQIINWMEAHELGIGYKENALRMMLINKVNGIDATENYFNSLPPSVKNTHAALGTLLFCYYEVKEVDKALDVFGRLDSMNMTDAALPISNLMTLYVKIGQPEMVPPLMEEMKKWNIQPSSYAHNLPMHNYLCVNDVECVERLFEEMKQEKKVHDWATYSNLAFSYIRAGSRGKAEAALKEMEEEMDSNNCECFHLLISLYAKIHDLQKVHHVWKSLKSKFKQVSNNSYLIMLDALSRLKDFDGMKNCYKEWESECSLFDIRLANLLICTYLRHEKADEAQLIFRGVLKRSQGPIFEACEHFMTYYLKKEQIKPALRYLKVATSENSDLMWQPKEDIVHGFVNYFEKQDDVFSTKQFCELAKKINCIDRELYKSLLGQAHKKEENAYGLLVTDIFKDYK